MNTEIKILLTINLEGGLLIRGEKEVRKYFLTKKDLFPKNYKGDGNKVIKSGKYVYVHTKPNSVKQTIKLCRDAYDYMISPITPSWYHSQKEWKKMTETQRLEMNLARTAKHFGGKSFTYQIVDD